MSPLRASLLASCVPLLVGCKMTLPPELAGHATQIDVSIPVFFGGDYRVGPYTTAGFRTLSESDAPVFLSLSKKRAAEKTFAFVLTRDGAVVREVKCRASRSESKVLGVLDTVDEEMKCLVGAPGGGPPGQLEMTDERHGTLRQGAEASTLEPTTSGVVGVILRRQGQAVAAWQYSTPTTAWIEGAADADTQATAAAVMTCAYVYQPFLAGAADNAQH